MLPYLEHSALFARYDPSQAWNAALNQTVAETDVSVFRCPSAIENWPGKTDYGGNSGSSLTGLTPGFQRGYAWEAGLLPPIKIGLPGDYRRHGVRVLEVLDGCSQTFLLLEDVDRPAKEGGMWASGYNCFAHDNGTINSEISNEIFSRHPGGAHALVGDGSVQFLSESISLTELGGLCTRAHGETVRL